MDKRFTIIKCLNSATLWVQRPIQIYRDLMSPGHWPCARQQQPRASNLLYEARSS